MRISRFLLGSSIAAGLLAACTSDPTTTSSTFAAKVSAPADATSTGTTDPVTGTVSAKAYMIGGTVTGLAGQGLVLSVNGNDVTVAANGSFTAGAPVPAGTAYAVTVQSQPTGPNQLCALGGDTGTVGTADVSTVTVDCFTDKYVVGGTATGIRGTGVALQVNGGDDIRVTANGKFAFPTARASGQLYTALATTKPQSPSETCTVTNGVGQVTDANATGIRLDCVLDSFTVGGTVSGLVGAVVLQDNNGDDLPLSANMPWTFATPVTSGTDYTVAVETQPANQTCTVTQTSTSVNNGPVSDVAVTCVTNDYTVSGMVTGLAAGDSIVLGNGSDSATPNPDGSFTFPSRLQTGTTYAVSITTAPTTNKYCSISNGSATMGSANVSNVSATCSAYPVACTSGNDLETASSWVVCAANASSAWVSANAGSVYHATQICQTLGYTTLGSYGGTCGSICGFCESTPSSCSAPGRRNFQGSGNQGADANGVKLGSTVMWECLP